jgi:hypothetical protein
MNKYACELSSALDKDLDEYDPDKEEIVDEPEMPDVPEDLDEDIIREIEHKEVEEE